MLFLALSLIKLVCNAEFARSETRSDIFGKKKFRNIIIIKSSEIQKGKKRSDLKGVLKNVQV